MFAREIWARQYWTRNSLTGCPKGQVMRGTLKGIKHLPSRRSDRSALNNQNNRKLAKLTRSEQGNGEYWSANRKYKRHLDFQNMHHLTKQFSKVGDWHVWKYGPNAPVTQIPNRYCGGWEEKFWMHCPAKSAAKRSDLKLESWNFRPKVDGRSGPWGPLLPERNLTFWCT